MICNSLTDVCFIYLDHHLEGRNAENIMKSKQHLFCLSLVLSLVCSTATNHQIMPSQYISDEKESAIK